MTGLLEAPQASKAGSKEPLNGLTAAGVQAETANQAKDAAETEKEVKSKTDTATKSAKDAAVRKAGLARMVATVSTPDQPQIWKLKVSIAESGFKTNLNKAKTVQEIESAINEYKKGLELEPAAEEVLNNLAEKELQIGQGTIHPAEVSEEEVSKAIAGMKDAAIAEQDTPEMREHVAKAISATKQVQKTLESQADSQAKLNIFEKVRNRIITRWTRLSFKVKHFSRRLLGVKKSKDEVYKEAIASGFSQEEAGAIVRDF